MKAKMNTIEGVDYSIKMVAEFADYIEEILESIEDAKSQVDPFFGFKIKEYPKAQDLKIFKVLEICDNNYWGSKSVNFKKLNEIFPSAKEEALKELNVYKDSCQEIESYYFEVGKKFAELMAHLGVTESDVFNDTRDTFPANPLQDFQTKIQRHIKLVEDLITKENNRVENEKIAEEKRIEEESKLFDNHLKVFIANFVSINMDAALILEDLLGKKLTDMFSYHPKLDLESQLGNKLNLAMDKILEKSKYLKLAHYMLKNRHDFSCGLETVRDALNGFEIETQVDQELYNELIAIVNSDETDGRVFRDCEHNYSYIFSNLVDQELYKRYQIITGMISAREETALF